MTELELYKYIHDNAIQWINSDNDGTLDVMIFPYAFQIEEFATLVKGCNLDEGIQCILRNGYFAIWMREICDYYGIDMDKVFFENW